MAQETQTWALYQPKGVGWGGRWEGVSKGKRYMYTYGWFMLRFDRKQQNYRKQLSFSSVLLFNRVGLFAAWWTAAHQASLSITNSQSLLRLIPIELVMPFNHLILCHPFSPAFSLSQHQGLFKWVSSLYHLAKVLELQLQHQSFQWIFRTDFL